MNADRKVYDSDIAMTPLLREIAHTYVREYVGNFDMLIEARAYYHEHGQLAEGMFRPVLNTLRTDVMRTDLWAAAYALLRTAQVDRDAEIIPINRWQRAEQVRKKPFMRMYNGKCKVPFATACRPVRGPVVHLLREELEVKWWRERTPDRELVMDGPLTTVELRAKLMCSPYLHNKKLWMEHPTYDIAFPGTFEGGEGLMPFCRGCVRINAEQPDAAVHKGDVF